MPFLPPNQQCQSTEGTIFTQSSYSFLSTCLYHCSLFCCSTSVMSSVLNLSLSSLLGNLSLPKCHTAHTPPSDHSHLCFSFLAGQVSLPCNMLFHTQLLYSLPLIISDTSLLVSNATKCLDLFQPVRILASTAASASHPHSACHLGNKTYPLTLAFALAPISTLVWPAVVTRFK